MARTGNRVLRARLARLDLPDPQALREAMERMEREAKQVRPVLWDRRAPVVLSVQAGRPAPLVPRVRRGPRATRASLLRRALRDTRGRW